MAKKAAATGKAKRAKAKKVRRERAKVVGEKVAKKKKTTSTLTSSLSSIANKINKRSEKDYGYDVADQAFSDITDWITTTCTPLDVTLWGGYPRGRVIEIHGDPSVGKSTSMEAAFAGNQRVAGECVLIMSESCIDKKRMVREGIDMSRILFVEGNTVEDNILYIYDVLRAREEMDPEACRKNPLILGWDTPSNSQERAIWENPDKEFTGGMASKARTVRNALRTITPLAGRLNVSVFLLLQVHQKIGTPYAGKDTDCGGGPKFNASLRINARQKEKIESDDPEMTGIVSELTVIKSKAGCPPFRKCDVVIRSLTGIDNDMSMFLYLRSVPLCDHCPACGGKKAIVDAAGNRVWESMVWKTCPTCNGSGRVYRLFDKGQWTNIGVEGKDHNGNKTQWKYIVGWPPDPNIAFRDDDIRKVCDARPGLRTWMAEQCWAQCTKPEPPKIHPVE